MKRPASDSLQGGPGVLGQQERTREKQGDQAVPVVLGEILDRGHVLQARVGHHEVEAAEALDRRVHCGAVARARGQVGLERHARAAGRVEVHAQHLPRRRPRAARRSPGRCRSPLRSRLHRTGENLQSRRCRGEGKLLWEPSRERLDGLEAGALHAQARGTAPMTSCGAGRSRTSRASGARSGSCTRSGRRPSACWATPRCRAPSGFPARSSTTPSTCSARHRSGDGDPARERVEPAGRAELGRAARRRGALRRRAAAAGRGDAATAWSAYMPNVAETVIAFLATRQHRRDLVELRAGVRHADGGRPLRQIEPKVLIAIEGYRYGGPRLRPARRASREIEAALPTLEHTVMVPSGWDELLSEPAELVVRAGARSTTRSGCCSRRAPRGCRRRSCRATAASCSSTSRRLNLHSDLSEADRFFWYTTTGWMMWNFLVGGLLAGSAIVLYDGQPDPQRLWELAARGGGHLLRHQRGVHRRLHEGGRRAAAAAASCAASARPARRCRSRASSGSTSKLGDVWLFSTSGGTDLCTAFVGACPVLPVRAGELQARCARARRSRRGTRRAARSWARWGSS